VNYDIAIIGGGMAGASLAAALRDTGLQLALIDATPLNFHDDPRLIALNYSSVCFFKNLRLWDTLSKYAEAITQVHVSDRGHFGQIRIHAKELHLEALGYVIPAKYINLALNNYLQSQQHIHMLRPASLKKIDQHATHVDLIISENNEDRSCTAKYVIGADGTHSTVRTQLNLASEIIDYAQSALVTVTTLQRVHNNIAYERFHASGAIAMLPLQGLHCATILTDATGSVENLMTLDDENFRQYLQKAFGYRLGRFAKIDQRHVFPLRMLKVNNPVCERVVLIGNAAHTLHPIAAQGLNLTLAEIAKLAEVISTQNPGGTAIDLQTYRDWQIQQESVSTRLSHSLPSLFASDFALLNFVRQIGMLSLDILTPLKNRFALQAMGKTPHSPFLLTD